MIEHKTDMNITKYKNLNMIEHKTDMAITKIDKYKKLNNNSMTEHKRDILNTRQAGLDMPIHCHAWVYITCWEIPAENC